jgi:hypothetical protein
MPEESTSLESEIAKGHKSELIPAASHFVLLFSLIISPHFILGLSSVRFPKFFLTQFYMHFGEKVHAPNLLDLTTLEVLGGL